MRAEEYKISPEKFVLAGKRTEEDKKPETKPIGYFHDAFNRFKKNKASIVAAVIIILLALFAVFGPLTTPYKVSDTDAYFACTLPKSHITTALGLDVWDGCKKVSNNEFTFVYDYAIGVETGHYVIKNNEYELGQVLNLNKKYENQYTYRKDYYQKTGVIFMDLTAEQYQSIQKYQNETGIQVIYPYTDEAQRPKAVAYAKDANFWYSTSYSFGRTTINYDEDGNLIPIYQSYTGNDDYASIRVEGDTPAYDYAVKMQSGYRCRILYYEYYTYYHQAVLEDGIKSPLFLFGTTGSGKDVFTCLASGARFSFTLAILVATVNILIGVIYGSIEGYYGGKVDMVMERIVEILYDVPFIVVVTLLKYHMSSSSQALILFIAFFLTGWIGMASRTRMQFYRFKNQEYVLTARTLGVGDFKIMFRHILPNALGTLVTSCVLIIPSMIFTESTLTYLGIIDLESGNVTSVGTLLANAKAYMTSYPYMMVPPAIFICLLMLSFNLFGNGLRDAFNPSLRGTED